MKNIMEVTVIIAAIFIAMIINNEKQSIIIQHIEEIEHNIQLNEARTRVDNSRLNDSIRIIGKEIITNE